MTHYAPDIEQAILGTCLTDTFSFQEVRDLISPDVFYLENNRMVYKACLEFDEPDMFLVEERLKESGTLDKVGNNYVIDLVQKATPRHEQYCQILLEKKIIRDAVQSAQKILTSANDNVDPYALVDQFNTLATGLGQDSAIKHSLTPVEIQKRDKDKPKAEKLWTGVSTLDQGIFSDSLKRGQYVTTMADSGHGKTQFTLYLADLLRQRYNIAWFQMEGYDSETASRFEGAENVFICDDLYDIEQIKRECRRLKREHGLDYIVFDYIQNMECKQNISKAERLEYISKEIQKLAKELNLVCNPLSQVSIPKDRSGWHREPRDTDTRWSQQMKQDSDLMLSVFRPSKIDSLVTNDGFVLDWNEQAVDYASVYIKQAKVRHGVQEWKRFHMKHFDDGLKPFDKIYNMDEVSF